jgi:hypothetical protein
LALLAFEISDKKKRQARHKRETHAANLAEGTKGKARAEGYEARERAAALGQYLRMGRHSHIIPSLPPTRAHA